VGTVADRVKETTVTTGTGTYTLDGTVATFQTFVTGIDAIAGTPSPLVWTGVNYLCIQSDANGNNIDVEVGTGTLTDGGTGKDTLSRDTIVFSTNGNAAVDWGAGTKSIVCAPQAGDLGSGIESMKFYESTSGSLGTGAVSWSQAISSIDTTRSIVLPLARSSQKYKQDDGTGNASVNAMEITTATNVEIYIQNQNTGIYTVSFAVIQFYAGFLETNIQSGRSTLSTTSGVWETEDITVTAVTAFANTFVVLSGTGGLKESGGNDIDAMRAALTSATNMQFDMISTTGTNSYTNVGWQVVEPKSQYIQA